MFDQLDLVTYEEVVKLDYFKRKTLVLLGKAFKFVYFICTKNEIVHNIENNHLHLYNNQVNARVLIGQSAMVYCAGKLTEKSRVF